MSPSAQQERIQSMCKTLRLDRVAIDYGGLAQTASDQQVPYSDFLEQVQRCRDRSGLQAFKLQVSALQLPFVVLFAAVPRLGA